MKDIGLFLLLILLVAFAVIVYHGVTGEKK